MMILAWKQKLIVTRFGLTFGTLRFDGKTFLNTLSGFTSTWDYKTTNAIYADSPGVYTNDEISKLGTINENHLKYDVIDGSIVNGLRQVILFSFLLDKPPGYRVFCDPERNVYEKINLF